MNEEVGLKDRIEGGCRRSNRIRKTRRLQSPITEQTTTRQRRTKTKPPNWDRQLKVTNSSKISSNFGPYSVRIEGGVHVATTTVTEDLAEGKRAAREAYLEDSKAFASTLARQCSDQDAERLYCPVFKRNGCGCIQRYVESEGRRESEERVFGLLHLIKEAKRLSCQKCYDTNENRSESRRQRNIGLGNGQKKSKAFEEFVLSNRDRLRYEFHFCERATQRILVYSNNFLHKRLKTVPERGSRVRRRKGRAVLGLLPPIDRLVAERCCSSNCVSLAASHSRLVFDWRRRVTIGQVEARRVLAEMLTPSAGTKTNCYNFISLVTGCSNSTISKVSDQMKKSGGDREPPEHGLKRWHKTNQRNEKRTEEDEDAFSEVEPELNPVRTRLDPTIFHSFAHVRSNAALLLNVPSTFTQRKEINRIQQNVETIRATDDEIGPSFLLDAVPYQVEFDRLSTSLSVERSRNEQQNVVVIRSAVQSSLEEQVDSSSLHLDDSISYCIG